MTLGAAASVQHAGALTLAAAMATRTAVVAVVVVCGLRLFGKRELAQLNLYDLAMLMAVANAVQNAMTRGSGYLAVGMASAGSLLVLGAGYAAVSLRFPRLERTLVGSPTLLVFDGRLIPGRLRSGGVTAEQVMAAVREHGLGRLGDVWSVTLEVDGTLSVIAKTAHRRRHDRLVAPRPPAGP